MILHAVAAINCGHLRIAIQTVDAHIVVLAVWIVHELLDELLLTLSAI